MVCHSNLPGTDALSPTIEAQVVQSLAVGLAGENLFCLTALKKAVVICIT